jgi:hypothetical protein
MRIRSGLPTPEVYEIDPVALKNLSELLTLARNGSQRLLVYFPPTPIGILRRKLAESSRYRSPIDSLWRCYQERRMGTDVLKTKR